MGLPRFIAMAHEALNSKSLDNNCTDLDSKGSHRSLAISKKGNGTGNGTGNGMGNGMGSGNGKVLQYIK